MHASARFLLTAVVALSMGTTVAAQTPLICPTGPSSVSSTGADVIVGEIPDYNYYGNVSGVAAFAFGTTSCNIGSVNLLWQAGNPNHPVIAQHMYRLQNGRLEMVGQSWLKHGFAALQGSVCTPCQGGGSGSALGVGCSDPYSAGLNGGQSSAGAKSEVNAYTGAFPYPRVHTPSYPGTIGRRLQVKDADISSGARYFIECHYVTPDDAAAGNHYNNASYREIAINGTPGNYSVSFVGPTVRESSAVCAWVTEDDAAQGFVMDVPGEGRFEVGQSFVDNGNGTWTIVFAVHNLNSDDSAGSFTINFPGSTNISGAQFHDVDYHSNEVFSGTDWTPNIASNGITWSTQTIGQNVNANAIRWGTTYTFSCIADQLPSDVTIGTFKNPQNVNSAVFPPPTPGWETNNPESTLTINGASNNGFDGPIHVTQTIPATDSIDFSSTLAGNFYDVFVNFVPAQENFIVLPTSGQKVNIVLTDPLTFQLNNNFSSGIPAGTTQIPYTLNFPVAATAQMAVIAPSAPDSVYLSAALELEVVPFSNVITHALNDDNSVTVTCGPGGQHPYSSGISFFGTTYNSFFINSNGSVSFNSGSGDFTADAAQFRNEMPRLAGLWSDISPNAGGTVTSSDDGSGLLTISFTNVPEYGSSVINSFDMEFDMAGTSCAVRNYAPGASHGTTTLVGISPGGGAAANPVTWSSLVGGSGSGPANSATYQIVSGAAPQGFSEIIFPNGNSSTYSVN